MPDNAEKDGRPTVERLAPEEPDVCPVDGQTCRECPSYCLEVYPATSPASAYRPCAGCDEIGESCRSVGCPATSSVSTPEEGS